MTKTSGDPGEAILTLLGKRSELSPAEVAEAVGIGHSTAAKRLAALEREGKVRRSEGGRDGSRRLPDRWSIAQVDLAPTSNSEVIHDGQRLGRGQLAQLVLAELAAHADEPIGPARIATALGRSSGAVANALERLVRSGAATLVATTPRRYQVAASGRAAAAWSTAGEPARTKSRTTGKKKS